MCICVTSVVRMLRLLFRRYYLSWRNSCLNGVGLCICMTSVVPMLRLQLVGTI
jgi:hypothetical protein